MIRAFLILSLAGCGGAKHAPATWPKPAGWKTETIPFPLEFAPAIAHRGTEELRFPPGFLKPGTPNAWAYAFTWKLEDRAELDEHALAAELTVYFRGLMVAGDGDKQRIDPSTITVEVTRAATRFEIHAHLLDGFHDAEAIELEGWARRTSCGTGALWAFALAPPGSVARAAVDALAEQAHCE